MRKREAMAARLVASRQSGLISVSGVSANCFHRPCGACSAAWRKTRVFPFPGARTGRPSAPTPSSYARRRRAVSKADAGELPGSELGHRCVGIPPLLFRARNGNDIVVADPRVSRQYARIELRSGLVLSGRFQHQWYFTFWRRVTPEHCIKRDEFIGERATLAAVFAGGKCPTRWLCPRLKSRCGRWRRMKPRCVGYLSSPCRASSRAYGARGDSLRTLDVTKAADA